MKRLWLFLLAAACLFVAAYALEDRRTFFGGGPAQPVAGTSERPSVIAALSALDRGLTRFYESGDEGPARAALAEPDGQESPLPAWRADREAYAAAGQPVRFELRRRELLEVALPSLDAVSATARERWARRLGGSETVSEVEVRYLLRRTAAGLRVAEAAVAP